MPLRTPPMEQPELNLTPMVDVVLQLVIFFMVGTQFVDSERKIDITLPQVSVASPLSDTPDEIVVNISSSGEIQVGTRVFQPDELRTFMQDAVSKYSSQVVVVRGDRDCFYQQVMTVVDLCKQAGVETVQAAIRVDASSSGQ